LLEPPVTVDFYGLTPDKDFAKEFLIAWLQAHQVHIVNDPKEAQLRVKVFAPVLGVDQAQSFIGTPSFTVPFLGVTIPEIPLFRDVRHVGHAALESYTLEEDGGKFLDRSPTAMGQSTYDDYTVLIIIHFTRSDMEKSKWDWTAFSRPRPHKALMSDSIVALRCSAGDLMSLG
jgi:hypothetical protein